MAWCYGWLLHQFVWHSEPLGNINSILLLTFPEIPSLLHSCVRKGIQPCPCGFSSRGGSCGEAGASGVSSKQCDGNQLGRKTPLKGTNFPWCPKQAADAQRHFKTNTRYPVPALEFILLWRKQTWRNPCVAKQVDPLIPNEQLITVILGLTDRLKYHLVL